MASMKVKMFTVGLFFTNCYLVSCSKKKEAIIIDPGFDRESEAYTILDEIKTNDLQVKYIVNTHGHPDHTAGNGIVKKATGAPILIHEYDGGMLGERGKASAKTFGMKTTSPPADKLLHDGDIIQFGTASLQVLHTPGHSKGSISLLAENAVFTGDTLFAGSIGRTDFPDSSYQQILHSLKKRLMPLPDSFIVYPGHGPISTIGEEKKVNPFLRSEFGVL